MDKMRTFIAIELPNEIKDSLSRLQEKLKLTQADVKWVAPENIHLTLKFLGERNDKKVEKIKQVIDGIAAGNKSFQIRISSLGAFPKIDSPRIIWVGIDKGDSETKQIAESLETEIAKLGIPKEERPFSTHITIGRTRSNLNLINLVQVLKKLEGIFGKEEKEFKVNSITLFKSTLYPKGPLYEILKEAHLKTS